ncbi:MAG TPA: TolC family protein, partial [Ktedonobacterales bacterium]|nr:TolC family protein [Ktedonobacterales bacterium]
MAAGALGLASLLGGCHVGPKYHEPAAPTITAPNYKESTVNFQDAEGWKVASPQDAMIRGKWWEIFHEPELNALEEELDANNQSLKASYNNFMAARAIVGEARSQYWPTITVGPSFSRSRGSANVGNNNNNNNSNNGGASLWSIPFDASWTPDFFGKIRNEVRT